MRFRRLSSDELNELEPEFVKFLVSNTVTADDWEKLKVEDTVGAEELIDMFSDIVMEKVVAKIEFVEHREPNSLLIFKCEKEEISMVGLTVEAGADIDLTDENLQAKIENTPALLSDGSISTMKLTKKYSGNREEEIFAILDNGGMITDDRLFKVISTI